MRLILCGMLLLHSAGKLQNYNELMECYPSVGVLPQEAIFLMSGILEIGCSVLLAVGFKTRWAALILMVEMLAFMLWLGAERSKIEFV